MTRERHMILDISSSKEEAPQDEFIDHSLKVKKYLEAKAEEAGGISSEKLIKVFKEAAKEEAEMVKFKKLQRGQKQTLGAKDQEDHVFEEELSPGLDSFDIEKTKKN